MAADGAPEFSDAWDVENVETTKIRGILHLHYPQGSQGLSAARESSRKFFKAGGAAGDGFFRVFHEADRRAAGIKDGPLKRAEVRP